MAIPIEIIGDFKGRGEAKASVYNPRNGTFKGEAGFLVYTREKDIPTARILPMLNESYGNALNQDGSLGGIPILISDGGDTTAWTGSNISGSRVDFTSNFSGAGWPLSGSASVRANSPTLNNEWQFAKGSDQDLTGYVAISSKIYVNRRWTSGDSVSVYGWKSGAIVGNPVLLEDYIDEEMYDTVQQFVISLEDMGLTNATVDSFRFKQVGVAGNTGDFLMDDFQIEQTGNPIEFKTSHDPSVSYSANKMVITMVGPLAGTLADGAGNLPLSYDKLLNLSQLPVGLTLRSVYNGQIDFSAVLNNLGDFLTAGFHITNSGSDGTNSFITLEQEFTAPLRLEGLPDLNYIALTVNDDVSSLLKFNVVVRGSETSLEN